MNKPYITLREARENDASDIAKYQNLQDERIWLYEFRGYLPDLSTFILAEQGNTIIGTQGFMPYKFNINGSVVLTGRSERTKVHEAYRKGMLLPSLMEMAVSGAGTKGMQLLWGTTHAKTAFERCGFVHYSGFLKHYLLCINVANALGEIQSESQQKVRYGKLLCILPSVGVRCLLRAVSSPAKRDYEILSSPRNTQDMTKLYSKIRAEGNLIYIEQDEQFMKWLLEMGHREYLTYFAYSHDNLQAYAYVDISKPPKAMLVDFASLCNDALETIIDIICKDLSMRHIGFLHTACNTTNIKMRSLMSNLLFKGFMPVLKGGGMVVRPLGFNDVNRLNDLSSWYITPMWALL